MEASKNFILAKYNLVISPEEELILPPYKGSTLRGGFGSVFRKISCIQRNNQSCKECLLREKCAYSYIFATSPSIDSPVLKNLDDIPRPFIIEPPLDKKRIIKKKESLKFSLVLIGKAIEFLPYFIVAFKELGNSGLGKSRKKFVLKEITSSSLYNSNKSIIYSSQDNIVHNVGSKFSWPDIVENSIKYSKDTKKNSIIFNFFTPTRLKYNGEFVVFPQFHVLFRSLLRRISNLSYFHCGEKLNLDFKALISKSHKIKIDEINTRWNDWERYSSAQKKRMKLGGFTGEVRYNGDFEPFFPFLLLGQHTHVGKGATFGMGWYRMTDQQ